jgi:hypothetical protein
MLLPGMAAAYQPGRGIAQENPHSEALLSRQNYLLPSAEVGTDDGLPDAPVPAAVATWQWRNRRWGCPFLRVEGTWFR